MSVAERVLGTWRVQELPEIEAEWTALHAAAQDRWGWFPVLLVSNALGLWLMAFANTQAVSGGWGAAVLFWVSLMVMLLPSAGRLVMIEVARRERIAIVLGLGVAFYLVKLLHSPFAFTYSDEFLHLFNTNQILQTGALFRENPVLQVSPMFPGLSAVTAALTAISGLSTFVSGVLVIGVARLVLLLALFLFTEQASYSSRVAGLATLFYMCHSNFLFWSAQFAYESLALPLALAVLYMILRREGVAERNHYLGLSVLALVGIAAVVVTHHITSYVLAGFLLAWAMLVRTRLPQWLATWSNTFFIRSNSKLSNANFTTPFVATATMNSAELGSSHSERPEAGPQGLALFALIGALAWLVYVAILTLTYLSPLLTKGMFSLLQLILGEGQGRALFVSVSGDSAPLWERVVGIGAVVLSLAALPFGLAQIWHRARQNAPALLLSGAAIGYFGVLGMRLTTASWEMGNRASTYLFVGLAFALAMAAANLWTSERQSRGYQALFAAVVAVIFAGGVIAGWPPQLRLAQPYVVTTGQAIVATSGLATAQWMQQTLGPGHTVAADESNGRYILAYGEQYPLVGRYPFVREVVTQPTLDQWQRAAMAQWNLQYVVVDRRRSAWDNMTGYFFDRTAGSPEKRWFAPEVYEKYDQQPQASRVMDSGEIVVYNVEGVR